MSKVGGDKVSIVIPAYNAAELIKETVKSVIDQTYKNWELIIINDQSKDLTWQVLLQLAKEDQRIRVFDNKKNLRVAKTRNRGIELTTGRFLCFLDADDKWLPNKLEEQVNFMNETGAGFSFTGYEFADADCCPLGKRVFVPKMIDYKGLLRRNCIWTCTTMFDMNQIAKSDLMMPDLRLGEDVATWRHVVKKYGPAYGLNQVLSLYRRGRETLSSNKIRAVKQAWVNYRQVEGLNILQSIYYFFCYLVDAIRRRV